MSLPYFPKDALDITCEQAFDMLLGSIAMEEMALSHLLNAEGEKLQYVLGTLPGRPCSCATPREVLEVNRSVSELLDKVAYNQSLLKGKLQMVLDARDSLCPPAPVCPGPSINCCTWVAERNKPWLCGRPLSWKCESGCDRCTCWQGCSPGLLYLCPRHSVLVCFSFQMQANQAGPVRIALQRSCGCKNEIISVYEACASAPDCTVCISNCTVLTADDANASSCALQFILEAPCSVLVKKATLSFIDTKQE